MLDCYDPVPGVELEDDDFLYVDCTSCIHYHDVGWVSVCDLCSHGYDYPCGGLPVSEE